MKAINLKIGDIVDTWCTGMQVRGRVIEVRVNHFIVEHNPVRWGNDTYTKTTVSKSTPLQAKYKSPTTPASTYYGVKITY